MAENKGVLVVGGGFTGMTVALEAAEVGYEAIIVDKEPYLGGRVAQLNKYFPKLCPPTCGMEINFRRIRANSRVKYYTMAQIEKVSGQPGNFEVTVKLNPRYVNQNCTSCKECLDVCPVERANNFNFGMDNNKAIYSPHEMAFPEQYVIDEATCKKKECNKCVEVCKYKAINLEMQAETITLNVASIVYATGWNPYDANKMDNLGFGQNQNVITNMMMERLASFNGPTGGKILRPSDGKEAKNVVFVQCAGSRDENHLPYCSYICCMASLKQATYLRDQYEDSKAHIFYIDLRTPGKYEKFLAKVRADENVSFTKGKVAKITEDPGTKNLIVEAEDTESGKKAKVEADLVVLATGMEASAKNNGVAGAAKMNEYGFMADELQQPGIFSAGVAKQPVDVYSSGQDATGAALKAIQVIRS